MLRIRKIQDQLMDDEGMTLVEVMVAVFVITIGVISCVAFIASANLSTMVGRDLIVATTHGEYVLEEMHSRATLANITGTDWDDWAINQGLMTLPTENVAVVYVDAGADPLSIQATINWERNDRAHNISFLTELTK